MSKQNNDVKIYKSPDRKQYAVIGQNRFMIDSDSYIKEMVISEMWEYVQKNWTLLDRKEGEKQVAKLLDKSIF